MTTELDWIAVDWGTSNLRIWGLDAAGDTVFEASGPQGMARLTPQDYPGVLKGHLAQAGISENAQLDVLICGMAGARQGWVEAPYLDAPSDLASLAFAAVGVPLPETRLAISILPGVCQKPQGQEDVMRGEETQLLGLGQLLPGFSGAVCMPGTHSKWARLDGHRLESFHTAMTGEVFEALKSHTVLRHSLNGDSDGPRREDGFSAGVDAALERPDMLLSLMFKTRAASLLSGRSADWCSGYLSGLLIGTEVASHRDWIGEDPLPLIGSPRLCALYAHALGQIGAPTRTIDAAHATLAGLKAARAQQDRRIV